MRLLPSILLLSSVQASSQSPSRKLLEKIANYAPETVVTDQLVVDLDQKMIVDSLVPGSGDGFGPALAVYEVGAHSEPIARLVMDPPLQMSFSKGASVEGFNIAGTDEVIGYLLDNYEEGDAVIEVGYNISSSLGAKKCEVGGSPYPRMEGCFKSSDRILIDGTERLDYSYDVSTQNINGQAIKHFSTQARKRLFECNGPGERCPYADYDMYRTYYDSFTYADGWLIAVAGGSKTSFANGNVDFGSLTEEGRFEAFKRGTVYLHFFMEVIGQMEKAADKCSDTDSSSIENWDRAVAYYVGSLQGSNGLGEGVLLYSWADQMCVLFNTCGEDSDEPSGRSYVNHKVIGHFSDGKTSLSLEECNLVEQKRNRIVEMMLVPLVQVLIYEAHQISVGRTSPGGYGAGAAALTAILPYIDLCEPEDAELLYDQLKADRLSTVDFSEIKSILERSYSCLGIQCGEVGGVYDHNSRSYFRDAEPCNASGETPKKKKKSGDGGASGLAIGLGVGGAVLVLIIVLMSLCCGEKAAPSPSGFAPTDEEAVVT